MINGSRVCNHSNDYTDRVDFARYIFSFMDQPGMDKAYRTFSGNCCELGNEDSEVSVRPEQVRPYVYS